MDCSFEVQDARGILVFRNKSKTHALWIHNVPSDGRRKLTAIALVNPDSYLMFDRFGDPIDTSRLAYSFELVKT